MWIKSDIAMADNPKLQRTAEAMSLPPIIIAGALHHLWWWVAKNRDTGDVSGLTPLKLAEVSGWPAFEVYQRENRRRATSADDIYNGADWVTNLLTFGWIDYTAPESEVFPPVSFGVAWCDPLTPLPPGCVIHDWNVYSQDRLKAREYARQSRAKTRKPTVT